MLLFFYQILFKENFNFYFVSSIKYLLKIYIKYHYSIRGGEGYGKL